MENRAKLIKNIYKSSGWRQKIYELPEKCGYMAVFLSPSPLRWRNNYYAGVFRMESGCLGVAFESYGRISLYKI